ncbi:MAG: Zn-finger containing protein, partial [uncultured archaeon A07HR67]
MSDGFDKEAEREKLREKFAEDEKKREHTQRMSELLLQGATMTNRHCETCGDPIFRNDGQEFCPTCHATDDGYELPANGAGDASENGRADATTGSATQNAADAGSSADEPAGVDAVETADAGTDPARGEPAESDPARTEPTGSDPARIDPAGSDDGRE